MSTQHGFLNVADVQKYSKQAIFAAHRSDAERCSKLLSDAAAVAADILPILTELPSLRYGSFSNAMEEVKDYAGANDPQAHRM